MSRREAKREWQRNQRRSFLEANGYSTKSHYGAGRLRRAILERDGYKCVVCGMTDAEHKARWGRPITIDHGDKNRQNNTPENLRTLCLICHGRKDITPRLKTPRLAPFRTEIMRRKLAGETYEQLAAAFGFTIAAVWKWVKRWAAEDGIELNDRRGPRPRQPRS